MDIDIDKRIRQISNAYYNIGLEKAKNRDLTGAVQALKESLRFNKYQTDSRNLLGLIYNEVGEVGAALAQWVISLNLQNEDNPAEEYLHDVRTTRGYLELADQSIRKYNQALNYARNDNEDLAILLLMRMLEDYPRYIRAQELLALLYMHREDYSRAGRCMYQALKVDRFNPTVQRYMDIIKHNTGRADAEKRKMKNVFSHRQMQDDDIIMPSSYKENTGLQSVLNIIAGLVIGTAAVFFLIVPGTKERMNQVHNEELRTQLESVNQKNIEIDDLKNRLQTAVSAQEQAESNLAGIESDSDHVLAQYRNLARIQSYLESDQLTNATLLYVDTDWSILTQDETISGIVSEIQAKMGESGYQILETQGDRAMNEEGDAQKAVDYYQQSLAIRADNASVIYKLGQAYQALGDTDTANQYYGDVIMNYANTEYADLAKQQRGY
jgi:tetratricopeptide (TPR) repeat protein